MGRLNGDGGALDEPATRARLERWLADALGAGRVAIEAVELLAGGAIQQNLALALRVHGGPDTSGAPAPDASTDGTALAAVLRRDAPATIRESRPRAQEHALLAAAHAAGVTVPRPLAFCADPDVIGAPFSLVARVDGVGLGQKVVRDTALGGDREALVERLGAELAAIHAIDPDRPSLDFLEAPADDPGAAAIRRLRDALDAMGAVRPALEAGLRALELNVPPAHGRALLHRDFRTGNLMLDGEGLVAILDWEFAGRGDPMEDIGWFCARCWRFSRPDLEAGGLGSRAAFHRGYEAAGGARIDGAAVRWWEAFAHARWAVIALQQGLRHASGRERSLSLALTGRLADALELRLLDSVAGSIEPTESTEADGAGIVDGARPAPSAAGVPDGTGDDVAGLLDVARESLDAVAGRSAGRDRLEVLMGAAAVATAARGLRHDPALAILERRLLEAAARPALPELARELRRGTFDGNAAVRRALLLRTALRAWVVRPDEPDGALRERHGLAPGAGAPVSV